MKLALIIDNYLPHSTLSSAKMFHELAVELENQGRRVVVITPQPKQATKLVKDKIDGIEIWRFRSGEIRGVGKIKRAINESLLPINAWSSIQEKVKVDGFDGFDGVIYYSPSIFFGYLVRKIKQYCKCPAYLILRDFFPQWAVDLGLISRGSLIERYFRFFERYLYKQAEVIGVMSQKNLNLFNESTRGAYKTQILRNWANVIPHTVSSNSESFRKRLGLTGKTIFFYGGNIGHAQDMANLMRLAKGMRKYSQAHFLFVGQGDEVKLIKQLAGKWSLKNFSYLPSISQEAFKNLLKEVDVGLFSLSANHTSHNFPGKLLGYMVENLPILGSVNRGNDLLDTINSYDAGLIFVNGEDEQLLDAAKRLLHEDGLRAKISDGATKLLHEQFSVRSAAYLITNSLSAFWC